MMLCFIKAISPWFPHRDAEMEQLLYHHSLFSFLPLLCRSFFLVWNDFGPLNIQYASHVRRALFTVEVDFYFMLTQLLCDNRNSGLSCWTSRLLFSGPSWVPSSSQGRPLKGCLHIDTVYIVLGAPLFKGFFFPACAGVWPARAGR